MTLGDKRRNFSKMVAMLLHYAEYLGYEYAIDYVKRCETCPVGHTFSAHKSALAIDLHLYMDKEYLSTGVEHDQLHDFWDMLGGAERIENDLNHYSLEHNGVR